jgi:2-dehydropantoate 2-reductase
MRIVVFGAGALGSLIGALLSRVHQVTLIGRQAHIEAIWASGLRLSGEVEGTFPVLAATAMDVPGDIDLVIVTVKAFDTAQAIDYLVRRVDPRTLVVSLQNGLTNEELFVTAFRDRAVMGTTSMGATLLAPGQVRFAGRGDTVFGSPTGASSNAALVADAFEGAGVKARVPVDIEAEIWMKGIVNAGLNPVTAVARVRNGAVLDDEDLRGIAVAACREASQVAQAEGVNLPSDPVARMLDTARMTAANVSSMLADVLNGRRTEIEEITGEIVRRAQEHGLEAPINSTLLRLVRAAGRQSEPFL